MSNFEFKLDAEYRNQMLDTLSALIDLFCDDFLSNAAYNERYDQLCDLMWVSLWV